MGPERVIFDTNKCKGCEICTTVCPKKIIYMDKDKINTKGYYPATVTKQEDCSSCGMCALVCPDVVIEVRKPPKEAKEVAKGE